MTTQRRGRAILVVAPYLPYPPDVGYSIRVFNLLRNLAERNRVTLVTYGIPQEEWKVEALAEQGIRTEIVPAPSRIRAPDVLGSVTRAQRIEARARQSLRSLMPGSYQGSYLSSRSLRDSLSRLFSEAQFDVVQLETSELCFLVPMARRTGAAVVLDELNIEYDMRLRIARAQHSRLKGVNNWLEGTKFKREERRCWSEVDGCLLVSERDRRIVARHRPDLPTALIANGADLATFAPQGTPDQEPRLLTFVGRMDYRPNADGVLWFAKEVLPLIRERHQVRLAIVGGGAPDEVRALASDAIDVTGRVPDVRPYLARAAVIPVPLSMGGGTRIKILESLAMARPVVSTTIGAEGLDVVDGEHLLIADEPPAMASAIIALLDDPGAAAAMGRRGRELIERQYDWGAIALALEAFYATLIESRYRPSAA